MQLRVQEKLANNSINIQVAIITCTTIYVLCPTK